MTQLEHQLQSACVRWFRYAHPDLALCLFAVPNGGKRDTTTASKLKKEGQTAGVADLLLLAPSYDGKYHALCIEMKTTKKGSRQRDSQKEWQKAVENTGNRYAICRTFDEFQTAIADHLGSWKADGIKKPSTTHDIIDTLAKLQGK